MKELRELVEKWRRRVRAMRMGADHNEEGYEADFVERYAADLARVLVTLGWKPIETAPKDGTEVLLAAPYAKPSAWAWSEAQGRWERDLDHEGTIFWTEDKEYGPAMWLPLPEPPADAP